jgi:hypothetical protein
VSSSALSVLRRCGQQYEEEHHDEIIERRQYGVDGDDTMNFAKALPKPFTERPRIGEHCRPSLYWIPVPEPLVCPRLHALAVPCCAVLCCALLYRAEMLRYTVLALAAIRVHHCSASACKVL